MPKVRMQDGTFIEVGTDALFADDGSTPFAPTAGPPADGSQYFTADDIARVRQEEKDKLYGRIESLTQELQGFKEQVGSLTAAEQRRQAQAEEEKARLEEEARRREEEELDAKSLIERRQQEWDQRLNEMNQTWEQRLEQERKEREAAEAIAAREREYNDLRTYIQEQVEANKDKIVPQLIGWIDGSSREQVDAAVARAIETSEQIANDVQQQFLAGTTDPAQQQHQQAVPVPGVPATPQPPATPGTRVTTGPSNDPAAFQTQLTPEQIANMPMSEYAKYRQHLVGSASQNNRGLYG